MGVTQTLRHQMAWRQQSHHLRLLPRTSSRTIAIMSAGPSCLELLPKRLEFRSLQVRKQMSEGKTMKEAHALWMASSERAAVMAGRDRVQM